MIRKGQLSLEFIAMVSMAIILLTIFLFLGTELLSEARSEEKLTGLRDMGDAIQSEIILAARAEPGYNRTFWLPEKVGSINYTIENTNVSFYLEHKYIRFTFFIPTIEGNLSKGYNRIETNTTNIKIIQP